MALKNNLSNFLTVHSLKTLRFFFELFNVKIQDRVVLHSFPDVDDQIRVLANSALKRLIPVVILVERDGLVLESEEFNGRVSLIKKKSLRGLIYSFNSRWIFFTHGIAWTQFPRESQTVINLWHGLPFKKVGIEIGVELPYCDYLISSSSETSHLMQRMYGSKLKPKILPFGFPRNDILRHQAQLSTTHNTTSLNLLWVPTYRSSQVGEIRTDGDPHGTNLGISKDDLELLDNRCFELGINLILKPHPMTKLHIPDHLKAISFYSNRDSNFYSSLADFDGIITDYSSIAADFAITNKPIYLFSTDHDSYEKSRGFFEMPERLLKLPIYDKVEHLVNAFKSPTSHVVNESVVRRIHSNYKTDSTDGIWNALYSTKSGIREARGQMRVTQEE